MLKKVLGRHQEKSAQLVPKLSDKMNQPSTREVTFPLVSVEDLSGTLSSFTLEQIVCLLEKIGCLLLDKIVGEITERSSQNPDKQLKQGVEFVKEAERVLKAQLVPKLSDEMNQPSTREVTFPLVSVEDLSGTLSSFTLEQTVCLLGKIASEITESSSQNPDKQYKQVVEYLKEAERVLNKYLAASFKSHW